MTHALDWPPILEAIEQGIKKAREDKLDSREEITDEYTAFVVLRELGRRGWSVSGPLPPSVANWPNED